MASSGSLKSEDEARIEKLFPYVVWGMVLIILSFIGWQIHGWWKSKKVIEKLVAEKLSNNPPARPWTLTVFHKKSGTKSEVHGLRPSISDRSVELEFSNHDGVQKLLRPTWKEKFLVDGERRDGILCEFKGTAEGLPTRSWVFLYWNIPGELLEGYSWSEDKQTGKDNSELLKNPKLSQESRTKCRELIAQNGGDFIIDSEVRLWKR